MCIRCFGQGQEVQQLILNIEKLAQMKATYQTMVNGYRMLEKGYGQVTELTKGNFDLHKEYLDGLLGVNNVVRQYYKIGLIMKNQASLVAEYTSAFDQLQRARMMSPAELISVKNNLVGIVNRSRDMLDELLLIVTPGKMKMNDEERISVIDRIDKDMGALLAELRTEVREKQHLSDARARRNKDMKAVKALYGLKQ